MATATDLVQGYYDEDPAREWERLEVHRTELALTKRALREHLPPLPGSVVDVGGGPGRYAIALARWGYDITLVDLSEGCLAFASRRAAEAGVELERMLQANALDLTELDDAVFDAALLLGPLYHLLDEGERRRAIMETLRIVKPGGRLFAAFITRFAPFRHAVREEPEWILREPVYARQVLETGVHDQGQMLPQVYFARPDEVLPLMENCGLRTLLLLGCEGIASGQEDRINELEGEPWEAWVDLNYRLGQEPSLLGASEHLLYIGEMPR